MKYRTASNGYSLVELLVVVAIILLVAGLAVPNLTQLVANYKLDAAGRSISSLMQVARIRAVKSNQAYYVSFDTTQTPNLAFVDSTPGAAAFTQGDPAMPLALNFTFQTNNMPNHEQLDAYLGGAAVAFKLGTPVGFNARGLPCVPSSAPGAPCTQLDPAAAGPPGFEWFVNGPSPTAWEAITVSPAGRIKSWRLSQLDPSKASCGFAACWM
jgi:prepilin-type N-terminal cleavage/methylation domain-containing protein